MATANGKSKKRTQKEADKDLSKTYNQFKEFEGHKYTGMKIGRSHKWYYDKGEWKETKVTPDLWTITYAVTKRRAGKAPEGSGVPIGTEYHWYILAHQHVRKLNANDYTTALTGLKYKLAHKRADKDRWNISDKAQRKRLIKMLKDMIVQLENAPENVSQAPETKIVPAPKKAMTKPAAASTRRKKTATRKKKAVKEV
ncbi:MULTISPECIES: hypothetical protein [Niastella]|uniref:DUF5872 domain-containing protein n=1 Tax=Niastella soli TaxID=2821487 RepID=A0ABS3Z6K4_9BACT|nr:hypothetical protein [Niastella soli]MBO9205091.1 hypothetical protein [Niastella soli]